ncbi:hypothetical protein ID866_7988 [Astraeus odoratus]|nr:hypothetical protein ID866_7988 [Astraeus odoratus]
MALPQHNREYGTKEYWDLRYTQESSDATFDWFKSYVDLADDIRTLVPDRSARILMLGCGNSRFSEEMWNDGYKNIVNVDVRMRVLTSSRIHLSKSSKIVQQRYQRCCGTGSVASIRLRSEFTSSCGCSVLRKGGAFIYITFGQPHFRKRFLMGTHTPETRLEIKTLGETFHYFMYILRKGL